jgi:hemoglobin
LEGKIFFQLEAPFEGEQLAAAGDSIVIESEVPHHVEFVEPGRFFVEFYRCAETPGG